MNTMMQFFNNIRRQNIHWTNCASQFFSRDTTNQNFNFFYFLSISLLVYIFPTAQIFPFINIERVLFSTRDLTRLGKSLETVIRIFFLEGKKKKKKKEKEKKEEPWNYDTEQDEKWKKTEATNLNWDDNCESWNWDNDDGKI